MPFGVVKGHHGLEPAGNGIRDERDQLPRVGGDDQPLALAGLEAIAVHLAGSDLAVHYARHRDAHLDLVVRPLAKGEFFLPEHLKLGGEHRLPGDLGQLADVEHQGVRYAAQRNQGQFPRAGFCIGGNLDLDERKAGDRRAGWPVDVFGHPGFDPFHERDCGRVCSRGGRCGGQRRRVRGHHRVPRGHHRRPRGYQFGHGRPSHLGLQLVELFPQQTHLLVAQSPEVVDQLGLHALAGDHHGLNVVHALPTEPDSERGALLTAGGIDKTDIRLHLGARFGRHRQQAD